MFNKYYGEVEIGEEWVSGGRTITEADIVNFAGVSGDFYPLHLDREYAKNTPFGEPIAHGMLVLSVATGLMNFTPGIIAAFYGMDKIRFVRPTLIGDTIKVKMKAIEKQERKNGTGVIAYDTKIVNQHGDAVIAGTLRLLINRALVAAEV